MRRLWRQILLILALLAMAGEARAWTVRSGHPRFLINADSLTVLRARWPGKAAYGYFIDRAYRELVPIGTNDQWVTDSWANVALALAIDQGQATPLHSDMPAKFNEKIAAGIPIGSISSSDRSIQTRGSFGRGDISCAYDWAYGSLTLDSKHAWRNRAWAIMYNYTMDQSASFLHRSAFCIPFIFAGDYDTGGAIDTNAFMLQKCHDFATVWEATIKCYEEAYGEKGGMSYYPGFQAAAGETYQDLLERTCIGYDGASLTSKWIHGASRYFFHQNRSDMLLLRPQGRWNEDTEGTIDWGPWAYNRDHYNWAWYSTNLVTTTYPNDSDYGNRLTTAILLFNPSPNGVTPNSAETRVYTNLTLGRVVWRDAWDMSPICNACTIPTSSQVEIFCGPMTDPDGVRWAGSFVLRRGIEDLIYQSGKWWSNDEDRHCDMYITSTTAANAFHVVNPAENLGGGSYSDWPNDGGQIRGSDTSYQTHYPDCNAYIKWAGVLDTIPRDAALDMGALCNMDGAYSAKVSYARRGFRIPTAGWMTVQTVAGLASTYNCWEGYNCAAKPAFPAGTSWTALRGDLSHGGIFESPGLAYYNLSAGSASCYVYPAYSSATRKTRLVGGPSSSGLEWRQMYRPNEINSVSSATDLSYECWMGDETNGTNVPECGLFRDGEGPPPFGHHVRADDITYRNSYDKTWGPSNKAMDWHVQTYWPNASGTLRAVSLINWGALTVGARNVTSAVNSGGVDLVTDGSGAVLIHEPYLYTTGYDNSLTSLVVTTVAVNTTCYIYGLQPGAYVASKGGTSHAVTVTHNAMTFLAETAGAWSIAPSGTPTGACCQHDGTCNVTTQAACNGTWHSDWTCTPNNCPLPTGACCNATTGVCSVTLQSACSGNWTQDGVCDPNPCPQPTGACCISGACTITFQASCTGIWTIHGSCTPNTCPQPTGACCEHLGNCEILTNDACLALVPAGLYRGDDTTCPPTVPCPMPIGACCNGANGTCIQRTEANCIPPRIWHIDLPCTPNPCPQPNGACCYADGTCAYIQDASCFGTWLGYAFTCSPNPCPQPSGACCAMDGSCTLVSQLSCLPPAHWQAGTCTPNPCIAYRACCYMTGICAFSDQSTCESGGGVWQELGSDCDPNPCVAIGACCFVGSACQVLSQPACLASNGQYIGDAVACTPDPCAHLVGSCCVHSGACTVTFQSACSGSWTEDVDCDPNPCEQPTGSCCHHDGTCEVNLSSDCTETWTMDGDCDPNPCAQPTGSCCIEGDCTLTVERDCAGQWLMDGSCDPNPCEQPTGTCCVHDGSCTVTLEAQCSGVWSEGGKCGPGACEQPTGSCCQHSGSCSVTLRAACTGTWTMDGVCTPNPCQQPTGSCCAANGSCTVVVQSACTGVWTQDGICTPNPCIHAASACCYWSGRCVLRVQSQCTDGIWLSGATCDPNPCYRPTWWWWWWFNHAN